MSTLISLYESFCHRSFCKCNSALHSLLESIDTENKPLTSIDLSYNYLGPRGLLPFLQVLTNVPLLQRLNLNAIRLNHEQIKELVGCLWNSFTLEYVDVGNNLLFDSSTPLILKLLKRITRIHTFLVHGNDFLPYSQSLIEDQLRLNRNHVEKLSIVPASPHCFVECDITISPNQSGGPLHRYNWRKNPQIHFCPKKKGLYHISMTVEDPRPTVEVGFVILRRTESVYRSEIWWEPRNILAETFSHHYRVYRDIYLEPSSHHFHPTLTPDARETDELSLSFDVFCGGPNGCGAGTGCACCYVIIPYAIRPMVGVRALIRVEWEAEASFNENDNEENQMLPILGKPIYLEPPSDTSLSTLEDVSLPMPVNWDHHTFAFEWQSSNDVPWRSRGDWKYWNHDHPFFSLSLVKSFSTNTVVELIVLFHCNQPVGEKDLDQHDKFSSDLSDIIGFDVLTEDPHSGKPPVCWHSPTSEDIRFPIKSPTLLESSDSSQSTSPVIMKRFRYDFHSSVDNSMEPGSPIYLIPFRHRQADSGEFYQDEKSSTPLSFTFEVFATSPIIMKPISLPHTWETSVLLHGVWDVNTSSGSRSLYENWRHNPCVLIEVKEMVKEKSTPDPILHAILVLTSGKDKCKPSLPTGTLNSKNYEGWESNSDPSLQLLLLKDNPPEYSIIAMSSFSSPEAICSAISLTPGRYVLLPTTRSAGYLGSFSIYMYGNASIVCDTVVTESLAKYMHVTLSRQYSEAILVHATQNKARQKYLDTMSWVEWNMEGSMMSSQSDTTKNDGEDPAVSDVLEAGLILNPCGIETNTKFSTAEACISDAKQNFLLSGEKYIDRYFPRGNSSIWLDPEAGESHVMTWNKFLVHEWRRPNEELFLHQSLPFKWGWIANWLNPKLGVPFSPLRWFHSGVAAIAAKPEWLRRILEFYDSDTGIACFRFYKYNNWHTVVIDDFLPVDKAGQLIFSGGPAKCENIVSSDPFIFPYDIWFPLLEKAYAKLHRCYEALRVDFVPKRPLQSLYTELLHDLTGGNVQWYDLHSPFEKHAKNEMEKPSYALLSLFSDLSDHVYTTKKRWWWHKLFIHTSREDVLMAGVCFRPESSIKPFGKFYHREVDAKWTPSEAVDYEELSHRGLEPDFLYSIVSVHTVDEYRLIQLRKDLSGCHDAPVWEGRWGVGKPNWTERIASSVHLTPCPEEIWMDEEEFFYYFTHMVVVQCGQFSNLKRVTCKTTEKAMTAVLPKMSLSHQTTYKSWLFCEMGTEDSPKMGGSWEDDTWVSNDQYVIEVLLKDQKMVNSLAVPHPIPVIIGYSLPDARLALIRQRHASLEYPVPLGLSVITTPKTHKGKNTPMLRITSKRPLEKDRRTLDPMATRDRFMDIWLFPNEDHTDWRNPLILMPFQSTPHPKPLKFSLWAECSAYSWIRGLRIRRLPRAEKVRMTGSWNSVLSLQGGPPNLNNGYWRFNPQYLLSPSETAEYTIVLSVPNFQNGKSNILKDPQNTDIVSGSQKMKGMSIGFSIHSLSDSSLRSLIEPNHLEYVIQGNIDALKNTVEDVFLLTSTSERLGKPYIIVPFLTHPDLQNHELDSFPSDILFTLDVVSHGPSIQLKPIPPEWNWRIMHTMISLSPEAENSGGSLAFPSWRNNPQLVVSFPFGLVNGAELALQVRRCYTYLDKSSREEIVDTLVETQNSLPVPSPPVTDKAVRSFITPPDIGMAVLHGESTKWGSGKRRVLSLNLRYPSPSSTPSVGSSSKMPCEPLEINSMNSTLDIGDGELVERKLEENQRGRNLLYDSGPQSVEIINKFLVLPPKTEDSIIIILYGGKPYDKVSLDLTIHSNIDFNITPVEEWEHVSVVDGSWVLGKTAGGARFLSENSWKNNPFFSIRPLHPTEIVVLLLHTSNQLWEKPKRRLVRNKSITLPMSHDDAFRTRHVGLDLVYSDEVYSTLASSPHDISGEALIWTILDPAIQVSDNSNMLLVPSMLQTQGKGNFKLMIFSDKAVLLGQVSKGKYISLP